MAWNPKANDIFLEALEILAPERRRGYLDDACADDTALRAQVDSLLLANDGAGSFLQAPASDPEATTDQPSRQVHEQIIGPYKLLEQIGEGGMGTVFMAEQEHPMRRQVALKLLKPGMDSKQVVARFEAERQALALMDHPNIAHVFDGGATEAGHPYFVMELVRGIPITAYCDQNRLPVRQRLELFVSVCQAVQHAHQKGIIHRDIKPSNVLVTLHDNPPHPTRSPRGGAGRVRGIVKVIDFGIAKATGQQLTDKTLFTGFAQMIGTPLYMSPEQAGMSGLDVDTRSDVYSLGVLLYELLTGTTPFDRERLREADFDELRQIIREEVPPRPSARLSTLGKAASTASALRQNDVRRLNLLLRGELDWVVMKALEKDRTRRYETASGFAADVQRFLNDEPVQACPPSRWYRFRKFARRNKPALSMTLLVVAVLLLGLGFSGWQAIRATRAEERTQVELGRAEVSLRRALEAVDQMLVEVGHTDLAGIPRMEPVRRRLLERGLKFLEEFLAERGDDRKIRFEAGRAYRRVGNIRELLGQDKKAAEAFDRAIALLKALANEEGLPAQRAELAWAYRDRGGLFSHLGRRSLAEADNRRARALQETLLAEDSANPTYQHDLSASLISWAGLLSSGGKLREAEKIYRRAVKLREVLAARFPNNSAHQGNLAGILNEFGKLLDTLGHPQEAEKTFRRVIDVAERGRQRVPDDPLLRRAAFLGHLHLGALLVLRGPARHAAAKAAHREAAKLGEGLVKDFPGIILYRVDLAGTYSNWGLLLWRKKLYNAAAGRHQQAAAMYERLVKDFPNVPGYACTLALTLHNLAVVRIDQGNRQDARKLLEKAVTYQLAALRIDPKDRKYRVSLTDHYSTLARVLERLKAPAEEVDRAYAKATALARKLADDFPKVPDYQHAAWSALHAWGDMSEERGSLKEARTRLSEALKYQKAALALDPRHPEYLKGLRNTYFNLTTVLGKMNREADAEELHRQVIRILEPLVAPGKPSPQARGLLGAALHNLALRHLDRKELAQARQLLEQAIPHQQAALKARPDDPDALQFLSNHYIHLANLLRQTGEAAAAEELTRKNIAVLERLVAGARPLSEARSLLGTTLYTQALRHLNRKELGPARKLLEQAIPHLQVVLTQTPGDPRILQSFSDCFVKLIDVLNRTGQRAEAAGRSRQAVAVMEELLPHHRNNPVFRSILGAKQNDVAHVLLAGGGVERPAPSALEKARRLLVKAIANQKAALDLKPGTEKYLLFLGYHYRNLGDALTKLGKPVEAGKAYRDCLAVQEKLVADFPANNRHRRDLASTCSRVRGLLNPDKQAAEMEQLDRKALAQWRELVSRDAKDVTYLHGLAWALYKLAVLRGYGGAMADARDLLTEAITHQKTARVLAPNDPVHRRELYEYHVKLAEACLELKEHARAAEAAEELVRLESNNWRSYYKAGELFIRSYQFVARDTRLTEVERQSLLKKYRDRVDELFYETSKRNPDDPNLQSGLAWFLAESSNPRFRNPKRAVEFALKAVKQNPKNGRYLNTLGMAHYRAGNHAKAVEALTASMKLTRGGGPWDWFFLAMAHRKLDNKAQARKWYDKGVQWLVEKKSKNKQLERFRDEAARLLGLEKAPQEKPPND